MTEIDFILQCRRRVEKKFNAGKVMIPIQNILQEYFRPFVQNVTEIYFNKSKTFFFIVALLSANPNALKKALDLQLQVN